MAWTIPRTWTHNEVVTATMMNAQLKENQLVLKTTRDATGRITNLSSATLGNLSGANLTGVAKLNASNDYTGGRHRYLEASRLILPVGANKWEDLPAGKRRGWWVELDALHHISQDETTERKYVGEFVSTPAGALPGSVWVEGDRWLHYIDASGNERRCESRGAVGAHADVNAIAGSSWVEDYVHIIREGGQEERPIHGDVAHADGTVHNDTHGDTAHQDVPHQDVGHADSHGDQHTDAAHNDVPHQDHTDGPPNDEEHTDVGHIDLAHLDTHGDSHTDVSHSDAHHSDNHTDSHSDHSDHGDNVHHDQPVIV